jgi:hypothetical protein
MHRWMWLVAGMFVLAQQAQACLRSTIDERAVQWSTVIVKATFQEGGPPADQPPQAWPALAILKWKVVESYDGKHKADDTITVLTFPSNDPDKPTLPCQEVPAKGHSQVMLLRPASECTFDKLGERVKQEKDAYVIVARLTAEEATEEAVKDLKQQIETTRKAEGQFSEKDAKFQAETLANALDDTEAEHADAALVTMGPKALPAVKEQLTKANPAGRNRLQRIIVELSPPPADTGKRAEPVKE